MESNRFEGWTLVKDDGWKYVWEQEDNDISLIVSHQPDHYAQENESNYPHVKREDDSQQVMRWSGRVVKGDGITVGINYHSICDSTCGKAESNVLDWAEELMQENPSGDVEEIKEWHQTNYQAF